MEKKKDILTEQCCECGNCIHYCPVHAIQLTRNAMGSAYAQADYDKCIGCGLCDRVCPIKQLDVLKEPIYTFAAVSRKPEARYSASGGIFLELALRILSNSGYIVGAAYDEQWNVQQCMISSAGELRKLQGSKYVKSNVEDSFALTEQVLKQGKWVLYSGTPCQIAALYQYLDRTTDQSRLITIDVICHGTPSLKLFQDYIAFLEKKHGEITDFVFRDKKYGHKLIGYYKTSKPYLLTSSESSYYSMFLQGTIYNQACYKCPFATSKRIGDFTLGDFWGAQIEIPEFYTQNSIRETESISAVILNTERAVKLFQDICSEIIVQEVKYEQIMKHNPQLNSPSRCNQEERQRLLRIYEEQGYDALDYDYIERAGLKRFLLRLTCYVPRNLKKYLKRFLLKQ